MRTDPLEGLINDVDDLDIEPPPAYIAALPQPTVSAGAVSPAPDAGSPPATSPPLLPAQTSPTLASPALSVSPTSPATSLISTLIPGTGTFAGISTLFNSHPELPRPFELVIDRPVPVPSVRLDDPADIVYRCPGLDNARPYPLSWYHLRGGNDDFLMCSKCHQDFVADTPYASDFVELKEHRDGMCSYAIPKAAYKLLPEAKRTRDGTALKAWAKDREEKRQCVPGDTFTPTDSIQWFAPKNNAINNVVICGECMDDIVSVTPFMDKFDAREMSGNVSWHCDGVHESLRNNLLRAGTIGPAAWDDFCTNMNRLQTQPFCDGKVVESTSRKWYTTSRPIHGFVCCERCYLDMVKASPFASDFVPYDQPPARDSLWGCDFSSPRMRYAFEVAIDHGSFDIWWMAMDAVVRKMLDRDERPDFVMDMWGLANVQTFTSWGEGCNSDFSLCGECYPAFVTPLRLEKFFRPRARGTGHRCSFCDGPSSAVRFPIYLMKLAQALDWGVWTPFYEVAFWLGYAPPCPRRNLVDPPGRRWWGWRPNLQICEECYWTFARDTWAEDHFDYKGVVTGDQKNICTLYSPLMRDKYRDACERQDVSELLAFGEERGHALGGGAYGLGAGPFGTVGSQIGGMGPGPMSPSLMGPVSPAVSNGYTYGTWGSGTGMPSVAAKVIYYEQEWERFDPSNMVSNNKANYASDLDLDLDLGLGLVPPDQSREYVYILVGVVSGLGSAFAYAALLYRGE
ncbi:hypothetical protein CcaverHIS002_0607680 [Cutaneotrichosporon cavernicola]|nr:hypothetical protein CcaverHIS002_0607680 [Cutaneotrichosporon cavernicola]